MFASWRKLATCFMNHMREVLWNGIPNTLSHAQALAASTFFFHFQIQNSTIPQATITGLEPGQR